MRQDLFVCFTNDKDLRHYESIKIKASHYTGIAVRVKNIAPSAMDNLLYAIELDDIASQQKEQELQAQGIVGEQPRLVNLRFEECRISKRAAQSLSEFFKKKMIIETLGLVKVAFEDVFDFRKVLEGVALNPKLNKITFANSVYDEEFYGKSIARMLMDTKSIKELDLSYLTFEHPKCFYEISTSILNERCRLTILKIRGTFLTNLEGKIIQYIIMKNKHLHTLDLSFCSTDDPDNFVCFLRKIDQFCNLRYLTIDSMQPDLSVGAEALGEALATNNKLEVLIMRENKIKWNSFANFWNLLQNNKTLQKLNLQKTDLQDKVVEKMGKFLEQPTCGLIHLDISKNLITDIGLIQMCHSLKLNTSLKYLNLSSNKIKDESLSDLVDFLDMNTKLEELALGGNIISNEGIMHLSRFLPNNSTLNHLEISKNNFTDSGFEVFAKALAFNKGLRFLDISRNKDLSDEASLVTLAEALVRNQSLKTLDLTALKIRKPFMKLHLEPALRKNMCLQKVIGKIPPGIIDNELETNMIIEKEVSKLSTKIKKINKGSFDLSLVETKDNMTKLELSNKPIRLFKPAFKLVKLHDIRSVDFTGMGVQDDHMNILASYLRTNPCLRSIVLNNNPFSDDGLAQIAKELKTNTKLAHLSFRGCPNITDEGLKQLCDVICQVNTVMFQIDLDIKNFDQKLANRCINESRLNRDIQEKLKPKKVLSELNFQNVESDMIQNDTKGIENQRTKMFAQYEARKRALQQAIQATDPDDSDGSHSFRMNSEADWDFQMPGVLEEVQFEANVPVAECFASALKCYRIQQPNVIQLVEQNLQDEHVEKLCEFLKDRNLVIRLNLRRNKIGNVGAEALAKLLHSHDHSITHVDLSRNAIGADGGQHLLTALQTTTRIIQFEINYGNPVSSKLGRIFEREIKANLQANESLRKMENFIRFDQVDKGPDYMRCAIKMTELQNILHLSLPDNRLCLEDARMLCDMIRKNTQLKTLNLSQNSLDANCAALLANSLVYNSNLQSLNLRDNRLGDLGVNLLIAPFIRKQLQQKEICSQQVPVFQDLQIKLIKQPAVSSARKSMQIEVLTNVELLNLKNNIITEEAFKVLATLNLLNADIMVETDDPQYIRLAHKLHLEQEVENQEKMRLLALDADVNKGKKKEKNKVGPASERSHLYSQGPESKESAGQENADEENPDEEQVEDEKSYEQKILMQKKKELLIKNHARRKNFQNKTRTCLQKFCCFKDEFNEFNSAKGVHPSSKQICCWRFLRARRQANQFYTSEATTKSFEKSTFISVLSWIITISYFSLYTIAILPFVMKGQTPAENKTDSIDATGNIDATQAQVDELAGRVLATVDGEMKMDHAQFDQIMRLVNMGFIGYSLIAEMLLLLVQMNKANLKICNQYVLAQLVTGVTQRATILLSAQLTAICLKESSSLSYIFGLIVGIGLIISQLRAVWIFTVGIKKNTENLLPNTARCYRLSYASGYFANALLYKKMILDPSKASVRQYKELNAEQEALMSYQILQPTSKESLCSKYFKWENPKFWQLLCSDIPLIIACPVAVVKKWVEIPLAIMIMAVTLLDAFIMWTYLAHSDECSINADEVFLAIEERKKLNQRKLQMLSAIDTEDICLLDMTDEDKKAVDNTLLDSERKKDDKQIKLVEGDADQELIVDHEQGADESAIFIKEENDVKPLIKLDLREAKQKEEQQEDEQ